MKLMSKYDEPLDEVSVSRTEGGGVRLVILVLFFLSGACGLTYEVVWMRMLTLVFGATAFATSTILDQYDSGILLWWAGFGWGLLWQSY
jgi:hypothetical protein